MNRATKLVHLLLLAFQAMTANAGNFFPSEYKQFPFKEGDLLVSQDSDGKYALNKVLKVDKVVVRKGESINIQGRRFTAPEDDYLLVVSASYGESEFRSVEQARSAAKAGNWRVRYSHIPNRPPGAAAGQTYVGTSAVTEAELQGYRLWRKAFEDGEAGVF
jgi:hypothetical protein